MPFDISSTTESPLRPSTLSQGSTILTTIREKKNENHMRRQIRWRNVRARDHAHTTCVHRNAVMPHIFRSNGNASVHRTNNNTTHMKKQNKTENTRRSVYVIRCRAIQSANRMQHTHTHTYIWITTIQLFELYGIVCRGKYTEQFPTKYCQFSFSLQYGICNCERVCV